VSSYQVFSYGMNVSFTMWREKVNEKGIQIGNKTYKVDFRIIAVGDKNATAEAAKVKSAAQKLCRGDYGRIDFLFSTYSSGYALTCAQQCEPFGIPSISGTSSDETTYRCTYTDANKTKLPAECKSDGQRRFQWAVSIQSKASNYLPGFLQLAKLNRARTVGVFYENASFPLAIYTGVKNTAEELNMPILYQTLVPRHTGYIGIENSTYPPPQTGLDENETKSLETLLQLIIENDADAVAGGTYYDLCRNLMYRFWQEGYLPKAIGMTTCMSQELINDIRDYVPYVMGASGWDYRLRGPAYAESQDNPIFHWPQKEGTATSSEQYRDAFVAHPLYKELYDAKKLVGDPSYQAAGAYPLGYAVHEVLRKTQSTNKLDWLDAWHSLQINTIYGPLTLDTTGINYAKEFITLQVDDDGKMQIVAPLSSATLEGIYPMPSWAERTFVYEPYSAVSEQVIVAIAAFFILATIGLMILFAIWREKPQVLAASILFCEIILGGGVIAFASLFFWGIWVTPWTCIVHPWLIVIGFDLLLGSLLIKNWRIQRIFKAASSLKKTSIPNTQLLRAIGLVMIVDVALLLVWHIAFTPTAVLNEPDPHRPSRNYYTCNSTVKAEWAGNGNSTIGISAQDVEDGFIGALGAYKGIQLVAGVVMAFMLRNTPSAFNEAKYIGYALYNMFFCLILLLLVWRLIPDDRVLAHALRSIVILWGIAISLAAIFVPKIYFVLSGDQNPNKDTQATRRTMNNSFAAEGESSSSSATDRADLRAQIVQLQKDLDSAKAEANRRAEGEGKKPEPTVATETKVEKMAESKPEAKAEAMKAAESSKAGAAKTDTKKKASSSSSSSVSAAADAKQESLDSKDETSNDKVSGDDESESAPASGSASGSPDVKLSAQTSESVSGSGSASGSGSGSGSGSASASISGSS